jgi:hypothetical protein
MTSKAKGNSTEGAKQPYQRYETWANNKFWLNGQYSKKGVEYWEKFLENMRQDAIKRGKLGNANT